MTEFYINNNNNKFPLQQGVIINGCIADNHSKEAFGLIITPRCDIGNGGKVSTIHYLPIVPLEDWLKVNCIMTAVRKFRKQLEKKLNQNGVSSSILNYFIPQQDIEALFNNVSNKKELVKMYKCYIDTIENGNYSNDYIIKNCKDEFNDLCKGNHNRYYMIKRWDDKERYCVIILRDVKRVSYEIAQKFVGGCLNHNFEETIYLNNDIFKTDDKTFFKTVAQISSPYIEHIIQSFSHNFCRIGVEDQLEPDSITAIYNINKIIQQ